MNKIDEVVKLLNINLNEIGNIVKYTRDETIFSKDIESFHCYNDDTYIEIVFWLASLCLGWYMSLVWYEKDPEVAKIVSDLLYKSSIRDFHESEFIKELEAYNVNNKSNDMDDFELCEEVSLDMETKEFVESAIEDVNNQFLKSELSVLRLKAFTYDSWRTELEIYRRQYDTGNMDSDDEKNLVSTEMAREVLNYINDNFVDIDPNDD